jgi:tetratricopeptide (TPR) repeat protein
VGNRPESIRFWKEITELDPENTLANDFIKRFTLRQRAIDHFDQKRYEEALSEFEEILLLDTSDQEAMRYRKMARGFVGQNSYKEGLKALEVGDDEKAYDLLKQALRYNTNKQDIQKQLDRIESRLKEKHQVESQNLYKDALDAFLAGDMEKALSLTQKSLELDEENLEAKRLYERLTPRKGN